MWCPKGLPVVRLVQRLFVLGKSCVDSPGEHEAV